MAKLGRKDDSQKSKHGGNYSGHHNRDGDQPKSPGGGGSSQAAGKDPHRGDHGRHR
jgi:hypothetical protein